MKYVRAVRAFLTESWPGLLMIAGAVVFLYFGAIEAGKGFGMLMYLMWR